MDQGFESAANQIEELFRQNLPWEDFVDRALELGFQPSIESMTNADITEPIEIRIDGY